MILRYLQIIKCLCATIILACSVMAVMAQSSVKLISGSERKISDAVVSYASFDNKITGQLITGKAGEVIIPLTPPFIVNVSHLSYKTFQDTIRYSSATLRLTENETHLDEVVVTGQFSPQSARNSVYRVNSIGKERISAQGAVSLQDVLSNALNIRFNRDNATGVAGISLQGIAGQNVKVLLDGVPLTGRSGVNNEIDLNQINVNEIERVEIVEGPMAVNYGSDALAGVINIITKKDSHERVDLNVGIHEETVGSEYGFFEEGIHSPSVSLGYKLNDHLYTRVGARLNRFGGWQGSSNGRSKEWYPKTQYLGDALVRYEKDNFSIYYKVNYLDELLENLGNITSPQFRDPFAVDEEYNAKRWMHQLQSDWVIGNIKSHSVLSYTNYERTSRQFITNLVTNEESTTVPSEQDTLGYNTLFFRNTFMGLADNQKLNTQLGLEGTYETANGTTLNEGTKAVTDLAVFASAEINIGEKLKVRPGIRASYNSIFSTLPMPSMNLKYSISENTQLRAGYGRGFRAPSVRELYHEFIDTNHNIIGNPDLEPERSHNFNVDLNHTFEKRKLRINLSGFYNFIDNRITLFFVETNQATTYTNLLQYKTTGGQVTVNYEIKNLQFAGGINYTGRYQALNENFDIPQFLFSPELNANLSYNFSGIDAQLNLFYKYTGRLERYALRTDANSGEPSPFLTEVDAFQLMDITLNKTIGKNLSASLGVRNVLDVTTINSTSTGGAHGGGPEAPVANGRSYFLQMNFQLTK